MSTAAVSSADPTGSLSTAATVVEDPGKPIGGAIYSETKYVSNATVRLTVGQAVVEFFCNQYSEQLDGTIGCQSKRKVF